MTTASRRGYGSRRSLLRIPLWRSCSRRNCWRAERAQGLAVNGGAAPWRGGRATPATPAVPKCCQTLGQPSTLPTKTTWARACRQCGKPQECGLLKRCAGITGRPAGSGLTACRVALMGQHEWVSAVLPVLASSRPGLHPRRARLSGRCNGQLRRKHCTGVCHGRGHGEASRSGPNGVLAVRACQLPSPRRGLPCVARHALEHVMVFYFGGCRWIPQAHGAVWRLSGLSHVRVRGAKGVQVCERVGPWHGRTPWSLSHWTPVLEHSNGRDFLGGSMGAACAPNPALGRPWGQETLACCVTTDHVLGYQAARCRRLWFENACTRMSADAEVHILVKHECVSTLLPVLAPTRPALHP
jgi:hypothetical protein